MKINIVSVEDSLISVGVRKVSAYARARYPDTGVYYIPLSNFFSLRNILRPRYSPDLDPRLDAQPMAEAIADADIVAFSSMTPVAGQTKAIISAVRRINPQAFIVWGGTHAIVVPEDAIQHADAVCTGEGEFAFAELLEAWDDGRDFTATRNFWFNHKGRIIRNGFRPVMTNDEMEQLPLPTYADNEFIYSRRARRYNVATSDEYMKFTGLVYNTIWAIGCPFSCTYCSNSKFVENDRSYLKLRHPSANRIVDEIAAAQIRHPHISGVALLDDSMMALPTRVLAEFAGVYKVKVGLPLYVPGVIPNYVSSEKVEILLEAGMICIRLGIQSGSRRVLDFYKRPTPPRKILAATEVLAKYRRFMIPPAYDLILDNPIETREDLLDTLELLYKIPRPFTVNAYSLRLQPNTAMVEQFQKLDTQPEQLSERSYKSLEPTLANCLIVLLTLIKPPRPLFERLLRRVRGVSEKQRTHPWLFFMLHLLYVGKRGAQHLRFMELSRLPGRVTWVLWRLGIVAFWHRHFIPHFRRDGPYATPERSRRSEPTFSLPILGRGSAATGAI